MKRLATSSSRPALIGGVAVFSTLLLSSTTLFAQLGTWAYPNTATEKVERFQELSEQLENLDKMREEYLAARTNAETALAEQVNQLRMAESALKAQQAPLYEAAEKFLQAQEIAAVDPMMDIEAHRAEYLRVEQETADSIRIHQEEVIRLNLLVANSTERLTNARTAMDNTLRQIDNLWQHRDNVDKIVFLRSVSD